MLKKYGIRYNATVVFLVLMTVYGPGPDELTRPFLQCICRIIAHDQPGNGNGGACISADEMSDIEKFSAPDRAHKC